jgi:hypothetical protein
MLSRQGAGTAALATGVDSPVPESKLRFVTPSVAIEDGISGRTLTDSGGPVTARFTAVWVKRDGRWLLDSLRESVAAQSAGDRLQELAWLLGEWVGTTGDGAVLVSSHWSDDGRYIIREFVDYGDDGEVVSGTQRIGWDASTNRIKSWAFDSQGGTGEGFWRRDGERWVVETTEVMPDGEKVTTSAVYVPRSEGRFVWEAAGAKLAGERVPPRRMEFKRAADDR